MKHLNMKYIGSDDHLTSMFKWCDSQQDVKGYAITTCLFILGSAQMLRAETAPAFISEEVPSESQEEELTRNQIQSSTRTRDSNRSGLKPVYYVKDSL